VTFPCESIVASSPRSWITFPINLTVWLVKLSRYWQLTRGVSIDSAMLYCVVEAFGLDDLGGG